MKTEDCVSSGNGRFRDHGGDRKGSNLFERLVASDAKTGKRLGTTKSFTTTWTMTTRSAQSGHVRRNGRNIPCCCTDH
jgi:hypothetical protein